jgi:hypothetical protein
MGRFRPLPRRRAGGIPHLLQGRAAKRLAASFGFLLLAFLVGSVTHSVGMFVGITGIGVALSLGLHLRRASRRS